MTSVPASSRVLKASDVRSLGSRIAFNYEDIRKQCEQHIVEVQAQARKIIEDAQQKAEEIRRQAQDTGRTHGRQEGMAEADRELNRRAQELAVREAERRLQTALPALEAAARHVAGERERWLAEWESSAVRLAVAIASRIVRAELSVQPELARGMITDALQTAAGSTRLRVRLHPDDIAELGPQAEDVVQSLASCGEATIIPDATIERGGSLVETQHGTIDARLDTQLERITSELLQRSL